MNTDPITAAVRKQYPVQLAGAKSGLVASAVYLAAYEVYAHLHGSQKAMLEGGCRGGFSAGELVAFLYARSFPKVEWSKRCDEAFNGMIMHRSATAEDHR